MIGQYLSHTNKRVIVTILQIISQVNKAGEPQLHLERRISGLMINILFTVRLARNYCEIEGKYLDCI
jgi:hypothetical protein